MKKEISKFEYIKNKEVKKEIPCHVINIPIYKCRLKIILNKNAKKLEKDWYKKLDNCGALTRNYLADEGSVAVSFFDSKPKIEDVVHEFHHATSMIMDYIGHKVHKDGDEPSAYLIGYLVKEYMKMKI